MGFFFRRRKNFGPFALNFSTRGVGISTGFTGARLSVGPIGTYVNLGRQGFYYRKKVSGFSQRTRNKSTGKSKSVEFANTLERPVELKKIESEDIKSFQDSSPDALLNEINEKSALIKYSDISFGAYAVIFPALIFFLAPWWVDLTVFILGVFSYSLFFKLDMERKDVSIMYDLDEEVKSSYEKIDKGFAELKKVSELWTVGITKAVSDLKKSSGASELVNRKPLYISHELPHFFNSNIIPYGFEVDNKQYYFFPDRILIYQGKEVGMVHYSKLEVNENTIGYVENEGVPKDAQILRYNWKYINKDGSPDKRFNNNFQIPVVLYSQIDLTTKSGINLRFIVSNIKTAQMFSDSFEDLKKIKTDANVTSIATKEN